ncbi:MAG: NfeD family protein [Verrucomicrobia bacterium]|nr:NfeD family protein [Verrucomicrobiota bacterium]
MDLFLVYLICFGVGLLFTLVSALMSHGFGHDATGHDTGGGTDGHAEAGFGSHDMPGFAALSPTTIASFVTAFGGLGMIFSKIGATQSAWVSVPLAALGGFAIAACVLWLFRAVFRSTQGSSESRVATLVGMTATVITAIPANGVGEIAYVQSGSRYTAPARAENGVPLGNGATVKITRIVGTQFYVASA